MKLSATLPFLLTVVPALVEAQNNFSRSCSDIKLFAPSESKHQRLSARCRRANGTQTYEFFFLNNCISNRFGYLESRENGNYGHSCRDCHLEANSVYLNCQCAHATNAWPDWRTRINLDDFVGNVNGVLRCFSYNSFAG